MAPVVKPNKTNRDPNHLPKINPPTKKIGDPKPRRRTQTMVTKKKIILVNITLLFLI